MTLKPVASQRVSAALRKLPVIAVDVGFSTSGASCGLAWRISEECVSKNCNFGAAITNVIAKLAPLPSEVLILEAPLSSCFHRSGRPVSRGPFENATKEGGHDTRYWSQSPGVGMAFAAFLFLRRIAAALESEYPTVHLIEGFVSRDVVKRQHHVVAAALRDEFIRPQQPIRTVSKPPGGEVISVLNLLDPSASNDPPVMLIPQSA